MPVDLPQLGEKLVLQPGVRGPSFDMYDYLLAVRDDAVEGVWPLALPQFGAHPAE